MTIVCGDSHTATHGAFGALAFGIGTSEVEHVLATQTLLQYKPKNPGTARRWPTGPRGHRQGLDPVPDRPDHHLRGCGQVVEYTGSVIRALTMEERMTVCNMSIEAGARAGMIAPDQTTFDYLRGREFAPQDFDAAVERWKQLPTDDGASYDQSRVFDGARSSRK
jgi:3-isopropylmalate/(R)-2-methylmalate dehydratase large subunit